MQSEIVTTKIGIVCGLASEAKIARYASPPGTAVTIRVSGASSQQAYLDAKALASTSVDVLVSFGVAGGLDAQYRPGTIVLGSSVQSPDGTIAQASEAVVVRLSNAARAAGLEAACGKFVGVDYVVSDTAQKRRLAEQSGAIAIDMESHAVARAAIEDGVAFAILRTIADPADHAIPQAALAMIGPDGRVKPCHAVKAILGRPQDLPQLVRLGRDNNAALRSLRRAAEALFPALL